MATPAALPTPVLVAKLEPYLLLAKSASGAAAAKLIKEATAAPGCYVFGELSECEGVKGLSKDAAHTQARNLMDLFQFGTLSSYLAAPQSLPQLSQSHVDKLRQLTLVSLATHSRSLDYGQLLDALKLNVYIGSNGTLEHNGTGSGSTSTTAAASRPSDPLVVRALEDVIIEAMYAGLLTGKLDQQRGMFYVDSVIGRDVGGDEEIARLEKELDEWSSRAASALAHLDERIEATRSEAAHRTQQRSKHDEQLAQVIASLHQQQHPGNHSRDSQPSEQQRGGGGWDEHEAMELDPPQDGLGQRASPSSKKKTKRSRS